jgi:hypothetical protein
MVTFMHFPHGPGGFPAQHFIPRPQGLLALQEPTAVQPASVESASPTPVSLVPVSLPESLTPVSPPLPVSPEESPLEVVSPDASGLMVETASSPPHAARTKQTERTVEVTRKEVMRSPRDKSLRRHRWGRQSSIAAVILLASCNKSGKGTPVGSAGVTPGTDVAKLGVVLKKGAMGEHATESVADLFSAERGQGFTTVESPEPLVLGLEDGKITFKGRPLPASVMKAQFVMRNDTGGKRTLCILIVGAHDEEASMWRNVQATKCESETAGRDIGRWKKHNAFVQDAALGDPIPEPPPHDDAVGD